MTLKTGMLVGIVGSEDIGVLIQIRASSNTCVIKLNNGTLKKNVPLEDVEEAKDMSDTKGNKTPIRLGESPVKPTKLASMPVKSPDKVKTTLEIGDSVRARCNGGSRWFPGKILRVNRDGTYDVEYSDGDIEKKMAPADVEFVLKNDKKLENLTVGDMVKARYQKGSKLFSGKITRVRSDGTYDIKYDDGDVETRVARDLIEPNSEGKRESDEAPIMRKSGFRVDQSVKARYNGGKKLFPGKIKRVHSDGTYDVLYEDGDEEKRVKAEHIEATNVKDGRDEDIKPVKTSSRSKPLTVGKKVKAHYKKGKRLFPGKITRVRSDGTYDIDYDDGEIETRVEAAQIEVDDEEDLFADSDEDKKPKTTTKKKKWIVGDRVKAYYGKGKRLFPGKIAKLHMNGTYDIKYDDGDSELRVDSSLIQDAEDDKEKLTSTNSSDSPKSKSLKEPLRVGDSVKAKYKRGAKFFSGKITRARMDGTFDIKYEDGDVEERVEADLIQRDDDEDKSKKKRNFEVGDVVKAPFQRGNKLFRGKISRVRSDGTYDVAFDDGDKDSHVPANLIQSEESDPRDEKPKKNTLKVGDSVNARYKKGKKLFDGKVTRVRSDGTYDIEYDDGDVEMRVDIEMIEVPEGKKSDDDVKSGSLKSKKSLKVGDKVRARYNKGSKMISGEIAAVHRDGTYDIRYEDGDKEKNVAAKDIEIEEREPESKSSSTLRVGDSVKASYKNGVKMFPGKISRIHSDGTYDITFNDGDSERRVPRSRIRSKSKEDNLPKKKNGFSIGDAVKAKYKMGTKYFPGKIARIRSDGTYDIEYDDGDSETHVDASLIVSTESETATKPVSKMKRFEVGDVVKARYKKGTKLFSGKITRVRSDGTYDIKYDDGDTEMHVESSHIEAEEELSSQDKKPESFTVGDKVNARYKGGLKRFPGKILKVRMDGTYDIEYDDGDTELRVKSSAIELIPDSKPKKIEAKASLDKDDIFGDSDSDDKTKKSRKSAVIKVGDVVEANFKQKGKFHRGKIVRVRSDGTFDIEYDVGASEGHVQVEDIKTVGDNQESGDKTKDPKKRTKSKSSNSDQEPPKSKSKKSKKHSSSESPGSDHETQAPIKKGARVTYRKAEDSKSRRIGIVRKVHSDGSCDVQYDHGETSKRVARKLLVECSDSEGSEDEPPSKKVVKTKEGPIFRRHERVLSSWRRSSKLSKPRMTEKWTKAMVLEKNADGTYTIRYSDGVVEEDVPSEALKPSKKKNTHSDSDGSSGKSDAPRRKRKREFRGGIGTESLFLLEQLAMTLFEEGFLKKKPKLQLLRGEDDSSSSDSSSSSTESGSEAYKSSKRNEVDKVLKRLFDSSSLQNYKRMFKENDVKNSGKISRSRIIALVENLISASRPTKESRINDDSHSVSHILSEWFATHDDLRIHRHFKFKTLMLAFAYAKCRLGKLRMEQSVATVLEGRFASYHENKRQLEIWQQKLGYRLFQTLQRNFHDHALPHMIPSRIRVSELSLIFEQVARQAIPNKPLDVYLQQQQLFPHHTLLLPEFLCCYYQLYGSENSTLSRYSGAVELRPIAFVASCLFSNGDIVCKRHGDLVRRLCVGRTPAQVDFILRFREAFESLLSTNTGGGNSQEELLLETSQLSVFAAKVVPDPSQLEPALTTLRKRSGAVSLVEIYGSCGFIIDELTSAPTIRNVVEKMRMRVDLADVRRIVGIVRNICVKILRFPNNADYWRIRVDNAAFQQKIGRFDGATSLLEAVGFVEHQKTHYELRGARDSEGKRVSALEKSALDSLREKCVQLDGELSLFDGVESLSSILERISKACEREGSHFALEECQMTLKNLSSYIENILKNPKDSRCWRIREANRTFQRQIGYLPYATELMESIGFDLVQTSHGNVYTLRGTGMTGPITKKSGQDTQLSASLSNFAFSSVSSQMEWFLWRRKQEIDSLLEDEMRYLHDIVGQFSQSQNNVKKNSTDGQFQASTEARDAAIVKMYPYGTNAIETFNKTSIQRRQIDMMRDVFKAMDVDQKVFLLEADFSRVFGSPSSIPAWSRFEAFDIGKDGKVDIHDFVAALGPLLDHPYELKTDKNGEQVASLLEDNTDPTLCEATSLAVGGLRLQTSCAVAATVLEGFLNHLFCIIQEPGNSLLWSISDKEPVGTKLLRFTAGRELLRLVGFRESSHPDDENIRNYELQPQRYSTTQSSNYGAQSIINEQETGATEGTEQTTASRINGHSMVLAANASAGADTIVVQRGQFVLRGAYMRIGAGIPDLHEERMVVEASSDEHTQGLTKLRLGIPLRFFHPAKELVSTVLLSSVELTKCLEISDTQTFAREIIINVVAKAVGKSPMTMESCSKELPVTNLVTTLVTSFEPIQIVSLTSSNLCVGPSMRYIAASNSDSDSPGVSIIKDQLSDRKLQAYWEGILLQAGISNKKVRLRDVKQVVHRNAYLSLMLPQEIEEDQLFSSKSDDFQVTYEEFRAFFQLPKRSVLLNCDEENEAKLQLPFTYLRKHFQLLLQAATSLTTGYKSVQAFELLRRVQKDVQDHTRVVSDDPQENTEGVELTLTVCQDLERAFVDSQRSGLLMWPEIVYFVRYNKRLMTPEMFPSLDTGDALVEGKRVSGSGEVAELVSGIHTSRVLVLYFDGCVEVWNLSSNSFVLESKTIVLFSTKKSFSKGKKERSEEESTSKSYMQACMDANQTGSSSLKSPEVQRSSSRIRQFKRSTGASGALVRFCAWDSVLCVNSSILQESGSETFRFFRLANNFVCPIRQVAVEHVKVELSTIPGKGSKRGHTKKSDCGSSSGVVKQFKVTKDGSKIVFLTGSETILWVACAGTGEILCHFNLQVTQVGNFQALFQMVEKHLPSGEIQTQLYATTTAKSYRHAGMWILPQGTKSVKALEKKRAFSFGNVKVSTVVHLDVRADLLFVASRDGSILVWSTTSDQSSPISPLVCLKIRLRSEELQSICCQTLREECKSIMIAGDTIEIDRWEVEVLQQFNPPPLRFALYLFDDGEIIRLAVSDKFDVRLVTLEDPAFEFDKFLAPVSGVEHNQARRVTLQKNQIIRVLFIALHHSRNGIFAQKAVQEFFKDLENHGMLWKTRDEMIKFAASYQKNVDIQLQIFYRHGDGEQVELTQPQHLKQDNPIERVQDTSPVLVVGAVLKSRTGDQAEFQIWKFATNWLTNEEFEPEQYQVDHARRALSLQSSYRLEADRVLRIRRDISRGERMLLMENRRAELVQSMKDNVRDIIAQIGRPDDAADRLLKSLSVFMLMSFDSQVGVDPVEAFFLKLFNQVPISDSISSSREISSFIEFIRSEEGSCLCFGAWVETVLKELTAPDSDKGLTGDWLSLLVRHVESTTFTTAELGAMLVDLGLANAITGSNSTHSVEHGFQSSLPSLMQQLHRFLCIDNKSLTFESAMDELLVPQIAVEFIVDCTNFSGFFQSKMEALSTSMTKLLENDQNIPEASYAMHLKARKWQNELRQLAQSQNTLQSKISGDGELEILKPTAEDLQHLQRFLMTPLPCVSLNLSSITLENRCDPIHCRDRFVMNASGRSEDGEVFVPLSVLYLFMDNEEKANRSFKQELTFLRKVQHLRAREFFLPACLDLMSVPILPTANGSMVCGGDSDEIRCIVAGSLKGWSSLSECLNFMRSSTFSIDYWKPLLWSWSIRVLMMLLTTQSERFSLRKSIDMDMLLVSPDGSDLRLCTLSVGEFVRFGESEDEVSLSRATAQVFGCFIYQLLHTFFSSEDKGEFDVDVAKLVEQDIDGEKLLFLKLLRVRWELEKMRN
ncbi:hypothetical protein PC112_g8759 [Phytophthora cactorum]|nr:hypothetical protein PC112_g8759 [Phytophthora cactorum]